MQKNTGTPNVSCAAVSLISLIAERMYSPRIEGSKMEKQILSGLSRIMIVLGYILQPITSKSVIT